MQPYAAKVCLRMQPNNLLQVGRVIAMKFDNGVMCYDGPVLVEEVEPCEDGNVAVTLRLKEKETVGHNGPGRVPVKDWGTVQFDEPLRRIE